MPQQCKRLSLHNLRQPLTELGIKPDLFSKRPTHISGTAVCLSIIHLTLYCTQPLPILTLPKLRRACGLGVTSPQRSSVEYAALRAPVLAVYVRWPKAWNKNQHSSPIIFLGSRLLTCDTATPPLGAQISLMPARQSSAMQLPSLSLSMSGPHTHRTKP